MSQLSSNKPAVVRPVVYDYGAPHRFLCDLLAHYKATSEFSIRQSTRAVEGCSQALVSQVLAGNRRLTRDQLPAFASVFSLNATEVDFMDELLKRIVAKKDGVRDPKSAPVAMTGERTPKNHILTSWLHPYVKDLVTLKGFSLDTKVLYKMLMGLAKPEQIEKSVQFLLREGFWRRNQNQRIVDDESLTVTTIGIPNESIRKAHKRALNIALRGFDIFPGIRRKSSTTLIAVNKERGVELRSLIDSFHRQLQDFIAAEDKEKPNDELLQVIIHLTPVGNKHD